MSNVRLYRVRNAISVALGKGVSARDAVRRAEQALEAKKPELVATLDALIEEIDARFGAHGAERDPGELYALASHIIDIADCLRGACIDNAGQAICHLADLSEELQTWDQQAVEIHIKVLRLLRAGGTGLSAERRKRIVEGLYKVTAKLIGEVTPAT